MEDNKKEWKIRKERKMNSCEITSPPLIKMLKNLSKTLKLEEHKNNSIEEYWRILEGLHHDPPIPFHCSLELSNKRKDIK